MHLEDLSTLKDIPGYKAILRAVLKTQIQSLVDQLSVATGEESVIITASISDGTLCNLGSHLGKDFLHSREEVKSQFLRHCLKKHHEQESSESTSPYPKKRRRNFIKSVENSPSENSSFDNFVLDTESPPSRAEQSKRNGKHFTMKKKMDNAHNTQNSLERSLIKSLLVNPSVSESAAPADNEDLNQLKSSNNYTDSYYCERQNLNTNASNENFDINETQNYEDQTSSNNFIENDNFDNQSGQLTGSKIIVKQEPDEDEIIITQVETGNQQTFAMDWPTGSSGRVSASGYTEEYGNQTGNDDITTNQYEDQSGIIYNPARNNIRGGNSVNNAKGHHSNLIQDITKGNHSNFIQDISKGRYSNHNQKGDKLWKRFECQECGKSFSQKCDLNRHRVIHTGERFHCSMCTKSFSQKHQRNLHEMSHKVNLPV